MTTTRFTVGDVVRYCRELFRVQRVNHLGTLVTLDLEYLDFPECGVEADIRPDACRPLNRPNDIPQNDAGR
jgi:hypothetical protein